MQYEQLDEKIKTSIEVFKNLKMKTSSDLPIDIIFNSSILFTCLALSGVKNYIDLLKEYILDFYSKGKLLDLFSFLESRNIHVPSEQIEFAQNLAKSKNYWRKY